MIATTSYSLFLTLATALLCLPIYSEAFQLQKNSRLVGYSTKSGASTTPTQQITARTNNSQLYNLFGNLFGNDSKQDGGNSNSNSAGAANNPVVDVFDIPTKVIKTKPLKFFLQIFFVGLQNTPFKGAWILNANEEVEEYLEVYFADGTGMMSVQFDASYGLRIKRKGNRPSLQYMLQESVLLHAVLDELESIAFGEGDGDVKEEDRLLQFAEGNEDVLSKVRAKLPARAAPEE